MRVTGTVQRKAWLAGEQPPVEEVRPGLWSVPVPIPGNPLRYTLSYLLSSGPALIVVDPGWDTEAGWQALTAGLGSAGATAADVGGIVVTHVHPDHHGLSARLRAASGAWVAMHPAERDSMPARHWDPALGPGRDRDWLRSCGVPPDVVAELTATRDHIGIFLAMPEPDVLLEHGDLVPGTGRRLRAVWTPGHTPGHLCLHEEAEDVLLTGDHVLPRITPNIGSQPGIADPPLAAYLESLHRIAAHDSAEALPAHEYRFHGLADRVRILQAHHDRRCQEILDVLARLGPATVWQVTEQLSWSRGWSSVRGFMRRAAIGETAAHLDYLSGLGQVRQAPGTADVPVTYTAQHGRTEQSAGMPAASQRGLRTAGPKVRPGATPGPAPG
jgi:glyoxylase-like metal-dependent hydrolase (beta-lactamase superfamily II)